MSNWLDETKNTADIQIVRGSFFPPIGSKKFFEEYRPPAELPVQTVVGHLRFAVVAVGRQLDLWRRSQTAASLDKIEAETVDGVSELILLWERAVYCEAKAEILKETLTADRRAAANNNAKTSDDTEEKYREFSADAISMIIGEERVHVESI